MGRAVSRGLVATNPVSRVRRPRDKQEKMRPLSEEQAARLLCGVRSTRREALCAAKLGLRQGKLLGRFWSDVDLNVVERSVDTHAAGARWGPTKTGESRRIALPGTLAATMERHRKMQAEKLRAGRWTTSASSFQISAAASTAATLMLRIGVPVNVAAQILGHKDLAMTLRRYAHVLPDMQRMAAAKIDEYSF